MTREDCVKEAHVKETRVKAKEELESGEVREKVCRSAAEFGRGNVIQ
jgi:hypothetical protein